jgi:hypothetical protein
MKIFTVNKNIHKFFNIGNEKLLPLCDEFLFCEPLLIDGEYGTWNASRFLIAVVTKLIFEIESKLNIIL